MTTIPTQAQYHAAEMNRLERQLLAVERAPLFERRGGMADYGRAMMETPDIIGERVGWILNGTYGYGACHKAREIVKRPRMNRVAALSALLAALDHNCPSEMARKAYNAMNEQQRQAVDQAIESAIVAYNANNEE